MAKSKEIGLILQGGGALGAFECGVVTELVAQGFQPVAVSGVSIGAVNAAAIAGARDGDIADSLRRVWDAITLPDAPWLPAAHQAALSMFGNPRFWHARTDYLDMANWDSFCDTSPMLRTLARECDFGQINDARHMRIGVTATEVQTGAQVTFCNQLAAEGLDATGNHRARGATLTPAHIMASGSLPPGFPPVDIDGAQYWDGGLFSNTPIDALLCMLTPDEVLDLPIYVVDLFPLEGLQAPGSIPEVLAQMTALQYQNRFWDDFGGTAALDEFVRMLDQVATLGHGHAVEKSPAFTWLLQLRALRNLEVIAGAPAASSGGYDFSPYGVQRQCAAGREAVRRHLRQKPAPQPLARVA